MQDAEFSHDIKLYRFARYDVDDDDDDDDDVTKTTTMMMMMMMMVVVMMMMMMVMMMISWQLTRTFQNNWSANDSQ